MEELIRHRRALHGIPEPGFNLKRTEAYLLSVLEGLGGVLFRPGKCAVAAFFDLGGADTLAFRADMDALPVAEQTGLPFASRMAGKSHACGHDGHMAILLRLCQWAAKNRDRGKHNLLAVFQPAEESGGGAQFLCRTGLFGLFTPSAIFGLHLWPDLPAGRVFSRPGVMMAQSCEVDITFSGRCAHIASPHQGADALLAAADFLAAVEKEPALARDLVGFGRLRAGKVRNVLADEAVLEGSWRSFCGGGREKGEQLLRRLCEEAAKGRSCRGTAAFSPGYPAVENDPQLYAEVKQKLGERLSFLPAPVWQSEDFSVYGRQMPSLFFFLGCASDYPLHHPRFSFDEGCLAQGFSLFRELLMG